MRLAALVLGLALCAPAAHARTIVSLVFDAGTADQARALPVLKRHGMRATFYVSSGQIGDPGRLTWRQLRHMQAIGHEIGGQTVNHARLPGLPVERMRAEVCGDRTRLLDRGIAADAFAYPFGAYTSAARDVVVGCGYSSGRLASGIAGAGKVCSRCPYAETLPPRNRFATRVPAGVQRTSSLARLTRAVRDAQRAGGGWVQILLHHVCDGCNRYAITERDLGRLLRWLNRREGVDVRTVRQLLDAEGPTVRARPPVRTVRRGARATFGIERGPAGIQKVRWFVDGRLVGSRSIPPWRLRWVATGLKRGMHGLRALLVDGAGNAALSPQVTFRSR